MAKATNVISFSRARADRILFAIICKLSERRGLPQPYKTPSDMAKDKYWTWSRKAIRKACEEGCRQRAVRRG